MSPESHDKRVHAMSRTKSSLARKAPSTDTPATAPETVSAPAAVQLTTDLSQANAMPSPALNLQDNLRQAWNAPVAQAAQDDRKIPVGWALTAVLLGCGAFWACLAMIVF